MVTSTQLALGHSKCNLGSDCHCHAASLSPPQFKLNQNGDRDREAANVNTFVSELHNTKHHTTQVSSSSLVDTDNKVGIYIIDNSTTNIIKYFCNKLNIFVCNKAPLAAGRCRQSARRHAMPIFQYPDPAPVAAGAGQVQVSPSPCLQNWS